jgi:hypothetical protein
MGFRTNPDRILENIDRARSRESDAPRSGTDLQANVRELDTEVPTSMRRIRSACAASSVSSSAPT